MPVCSRSHTRTQSNKEKADVVLRLSLYSSFYRQLLRLHCNAFGQMNIWISDVMTFILWHHLLSFSHGNVVTCKTCVCACVCVYIHLDRRTFICRLLSVTYQLPLEFWTSLPLTLCDLAVHIAAPKIQNIGSRRTSVCVSEMGYARTARCTSCFCACRMFVHVKHHLTGGSTLLCNQRPYPLLGGNTPTTPRFPLDFLYFLFWAVMPFVSPCPIHPTYTLFELPLS